MLRIGFGVGFTVILLTVLQSLASEIFKIQFTGENNESVVCTEVVEVVPSLHVQLYVYGAVPVGLAVRVTG